MWYHSSFLSRCVAGLVASPPAICLCSVRFLSQGCRLTASCRIAPRYFATCTWPRGLVASPRAGHFVVFCCRVTPCLTLSFLGQFCASVTCSLRYLFCYAPGHGNQPTPLSRAEFFGYYAFELKFCLRTVSLCAVLVCVISKGSTFLRLFSLPFQPPPRFTQCPL